MSSEIGWEAGFWLAAVALGAFLLFLYDWLRIFRRVFPKKRLAVAVEDFCYWMLCGSLIFAMLYRFNHGILRWFAVLGMACGMLLYHLTLSRLLLTYLPDLFSKIWKIILRPFHFCGRWIRKEMTFLSGKAKKVTKSLKKKLKRREKEGNIEIHEKERSSAVGQKQGKKTKKKKSKTTQPADPH